ncbi:hypothetical protein PBI_THONKO_91 [Mycobacterium phage Thonko]|uniref:Uncharacterized protein n=1 Tax=Mycobacterium phage Thonko TaxID=2282910 RepID=A0A346FCD6_9CAUD|nr:hypothetical protein I5G57_gp091 [Mycobacterium phage Thonko]AXN53361.1 hypothetical protein PBI_THONKO_91 [Mycobacterium phage Thonko]
MMGLPKNLDIGKTVAEFLALLRSIDNKLDRLIELQSDADREAA